MLRRRSHGVRVLGFAHTAASGMKAGSVVDLVEAEEVVRQAVDTAESMAGVQLESVVVSLSGGRLGSERFIADIELNGGAVGRWRHRRVLAAACRHSVRDGRAVLHSLPIGYSLDAATGIREPRGMLGHRFGVDMHMVTADVATVRNLMLAVERSHLDRRGHGGVALCRRSGLSGRRRRRSGRRRASISAPAPPRSRCFPAAASSMPTASRGAATTSPWTSPAALNTRISGAEQNRRRFMAQCSDRWVGRAGHDHGAFRLGMTSASRRSSISRATLVRIIKPRVEEILELARDRLATSPFAAEPRARVVLTGGGSQLPGIADLAARILGVRSRGPCEPATLRRGLHTGIAACLADG